MGNTHHGVDSPERYESWGVYLVIPRAMLFPSTCSRGTFSGSQRKCGKRLARADPGSQVGVPGDNGACGAIGWVADSICYPHGMEGL